MPQLGLGLGINKNRSRTPLQLLLKYTSAMWLPSKADGQPFPTLAPRTLPNGVSNVGWTQNVSNDLVLGIDVFGTVFITTNALNYLIYTSLPSSSFSVAIDGKMSIQGRTEIADTELALNSNLNTFYTNIDQVWVTVPKTVTTIEQARALLAGTVIRYQLATPIDTLNSPFTNPLIDLKGNAPLTLQGFAGTTSSGYVGVLCPNGKTVPFLKFDGANDYGIANHPSLEILGTSDFGFGKLISVPSLVTHYPFTKSESSEATTQYGLKITNTGVLSIILQGTTIQLATGLVITNLYAIWVERISGVLKCFINGVEVFSVANTTSLTSRPNFRVGALSTDVGGTTHTGFSNANVGSLVVVKTDVLKARTAYFKFTLSTFGI